MTQRQVECQAQGTTPAEVTKAKSPQHFLLLQRWLISKGTVTSARTASLHGKGTAQQEAIFSDKIFQWWLGRRTALESVGASETKCSPFTGGPFPDLWILILAYYEA